MQPQKAVYSWAREMLMKGRSLIAASSPSILFTSDVGLNVCDRRLNVRLQFFQSANPDLQRNGCILGNRFDETAYDVVIGAHKLNYY